MRLLIEIICCVGFVTLVACSNSKDSNEERRIVSDKVTAWVMPDTAAYKKFGKTRLSEYGFFKGNLADLAPSDCVFPYDINSSLFSDYALKKRFIYLPEGQQIKYHEKEVLDFPVGTVLIKNFYYDDEQLASGEGSILETRLLIREEHSWKALPYLWNPEQTEAYLEITGRQLPMQLATYGDIKYAVPDMLQCKSCHDQNGQIVPIGPSARQLNREGEQGVNQLKKLIALGWLKDTPPEDLWPAIVEWEDASAVLEERARAYLEINCGHCHQKNGPAKNTGLDLMTTATEVHAMGVFKAPVAAGKGSGGLKYDIVPGQPDQSILIYRMESTDPAIMMPELGRSVMHKEGVELVRKWVQQLKSDRN